MTPADHGRPVGVEDKRIVALVEQALALALEVTGWARLRIEHRDQRSVDSVLWADKQPEERVKTRWAVATEGLSEVYGYGPTLVAALEKLISRIPDAPRQMKDFYPDRVPNGLDRDP